MTTKIGPTASGASSAKSGSARGFYETLFQATTHKRKRENLERVWKALVSLHKRKVTEFGLANVAREIAKSRPGTPTYQSIRNRTGVHFRQVIAAYEAEFGLPHVRTNDDTDVDVIRALRDEPRLQLRYARVLDFNEALQLQVKLLLEQVGKLTTSSRPTAPPLPPGGVVVAFDEVDVYAFRKFLGKIESRDWEIGPRGELLDERKLELAPIGFVPALRKIAPSE